jgi:DNA-directed RNA polymerase specialized sigma24 family protein
MKSGDPTSSQGAGGFERTIWTDVLKVARQSTDATQAFDRLAKAYWSPLYKFVRRRGYQSADAEDLVQSFFKFLIQKKPLESVDPAKGRFRTFLLCVLRNFLANARDSGQAQKRGGGQIHVSLDVLWTCFRRSRQSGLEQSTIVQRMSALTPIGRMRWFYRL